MITGTLKNKVDAIWQDFYNENMAQTSDIVNQLTILMFIKMLDDKQNALEAQASVIGIEPDEEDLTFKHGEYINYIVRNGAKEENFRIPYEELRWKNFKNLNANDLSQRIKSYVIPFIKDPENKAVGKFAEYATKYTYAFDGKERLLTAVVDKLSDDEMNFTNTDLMGDVYEYMCGSGISGQYRTPRHIIDMAVEMMKPKIGERIIDPAMGTAGFLIESAKYIEAHQKEELLNTDSKRVFNEEMFVGCDNDQNMARIGYMNCILHNVKNPEITMDSLLEYENVKDMLGKYDLVLQNPPFAGSINESTINSKLLTITKTTKTELLFVALMIELMKIGGRGMSIVPSGVVENSGAAFKTLRKELVEHQKLIGVISMPNGIFQASSKKGSSSKGAGVKTYFLIFQKTNNGGTDNVWFYNMENDGYSLDVKRSPIEGSNIPDIIERFNNLEGENDRTRKDQSFLVPVQEIIDNDYSLSINSYREIEREKVEYRPTSEIFEDIMKSKETEDSILQKLMAMMEE
ncbi:MAG: N-6 DNA methylase [Clostridium perfringens]|nr:N-6 DNA methylase [Clostridium perfringens]